MPDWLDVFQWAIVGLAIFNVLFVAWLWRSA